MNIKILNEAIKTLLSEEQINELSPELKSKVKDLRKANWLAAQATVDNAQKEADKAKAKYDRINSRMEMSKKEYKEITTSVSREIEHLFDCYAYTYIEDGIYELHFSFKDDYISKEGTILPTAIKQLEQLLAEMTKKYGLNYTYKIDGNSVKVICEQPANYKEEDIIQQLKDGTFDDEDIIGLYNIYLNLNKLSVDDIANIMNKNWKIRCLFPSGWSNWTPDEVSEFAKDNSLYYLDDEGFKEFLETGYPEKLARALVKSDSRDSLADVWNIYYSNREISDEAQDVFLDDAENNIDEYIKDWMSYDIINVKDPNNIEFSDMYMALIAYWQEGLYDKIIDSVLKKVKSKDKEKVKQYFKDYQAKVEEKGPYNLSN